MALPRSPGSGEKSRTQDVTTSNGKTGVRKTLVLRGALATARLLDPGKAEKKSPAGTAVEGTIIIGLEVKRWADLHLLSLLSGAVVPSASSDARHTSCKDASPHPHPRSGRPRGLL